MTDDLSSVAATHGSTPGWIRTPTASSSSEDSDADHDPLHNGVDHDHEPPRKRRRVSITATPAMALSPLPIGLFVEDEHRFDTFGPAATASPSTTTSARRTTSLPVPDLSRSFHTHHNLHRAGGTSPYNNLLDRLDRIPSLHHFFVTIHVVSDYGDGTDADEDGSGSDTNMNRRIKTWRKKSATWPVEKKRSVGV